MSSGCAQLLWRHILDLLMSPHVLCQRVSGHFPSLARSYPRQLSSLFNKEKKNDKQRKPNLGTWWWVCLGSVPGTAWGQVPGTSRMSRFDVCVTPHGLDGTSAGQTGHFHGTNGTHPRDGCGPKVEVSCQMSLYLLVVLFPIHTTTSDS